MIRRFLAEGASALSARQLERLLDYVVRDKEATIRFVRATTRTPSWPRS
jgi:hypothetical protein